MTSDFSKRLKDGISPVLIDVANEEARLKREKAEVERQKEESLQRVVDNGLKAKDFFKLGISPVANDLEEQLVGAIQSRDNDDELKSILKIESKLRQSEKCYLQLGISYTSEAFSVKVGASAPGANSFVQDQSYTLDEFNHDSALLWLEENAIQAARYLIDNNRSK